MKVRLPMPRALLALLPALVLSTPAEAHIVASRLGDFYAGALHPLTGLVDVLLWAALGLLAGMQPLGRARWLVPLFPLGLLAGLLLGLHGGVPGGAVLDAGMMVAVGGLLAAAARLPVSALCALALVLGAWRGMANAAGVAPETNVTLFAAGFAVAGYAAITLAAAAAAAFLGPGQGWRSITLRAAGSWIAAIGLMAGGLALRPM
jgi:urease accessory protein